MIVSNQCAFYCTKTEEKADIVIVCLILTAVWFPCYLVAQFSLLPEACPYEQFHLVPPSSFDQAINSWEPLLEETSSPAMSSLWQQSEAVRELSRNLTQWFSWNRPITGSIIWLFLALPMPLQCAGIVCGSAFRAPVTTALSSAAKATSKHT